MTLTLNVLGIPRTVEPESAVIAGFTGRDQEDVVDHLLELEALGIPTPDTVPMFYTIPTDLLVQDNRMLAVHTCTSGEAEVVLIVDRGEVMVALGSDHTDRAAERHGIGIAKGLCTKPISGDAWPLEHVENHMDQLEIRSWITDGGVEVLYQAGRLSEILPLTELLAQVPFTCQPRSFVLFTGTVPAIGGIRGSQSFRAELFDPVRRRSITLDYQTMVQVGLARTRVPAMAYEKGAGLP